MAQANRARPSISIATAGSGSLTVYSQAGNYSFTPLRPSRCARVAWAVICLAGRIPTSPTTVLTGGRPPARLREGGRPGEFYDPTPSVAFERLHRLVRVTRGSAIITDAVSLRAAGGLKRPSVIVVGRRRRFSSKECPSGSMKRAPRFGSCAICSSRIYRPNELGDIQTETRRAWRADAGGVADVISPAAMRLGVVVDVRAWHLRIW